MLHNPFREYFFPNVQSKSPLAQVEEISSCSITVFLDKRVTSTAPQPPLRKDSMYPELPSLRAKYPQFPQLPLVRFTLHTLYQHCHPSLAMLQCLNAFLVVKSLKLNTILKVRPHRRPICAYSCWTRYFQYRPRCCSAFLAALAHFWPMYSVSFKPVPPGSIPSVFQLLFPPSACSASQHSCDAAQDPALIPPSPTLQASAPQLCPHSPSADRQSCRTGCQCKLTAWCSSTSSRLFIKIFRELAAVLSIAGHSWILLHLPQLLGLARSVFFTRWNIGPPKPQAANFFRRTMWEKAQEMLLKSR